MIKDFTIEAYAGSEREAALTTLIAKLRDARADVVGLSECWYKPDRERIIRELAGVYPHVLEGPAHGDALGVGPWYAHTGAAIAGIDLLVPIGCGLLLLSRHTIQTSNWTQYVHATGGDAYSTKGALHARLQVGQDECDVFLTHMQAKIESDASSEDLRLAQLRHLASFIRSCSSPERPALLMGDLNVKEDQYDVMRTILPPCDDLWTVCGEPPPDATPGNGTSGITLDGANNFAGSPVPPRARYGAPSPNDNSRVDYMLSWPGNARKPLFRRTTLVTGRTAAGRDISDHYGLLAEQTHLREPAVDLAGRIRKVVLELHAFHCMRVTRWQEVILVSAIPTFPARGDDDEVQFELRFRSERGETGHAAAGDTTYTAVSTGDTFALPAAKVLRLELGDPGAWLDVLGTGTEIDLGPTPLGEAARHISREALLRHGFWSSYDYVLPRLTGDGGEYALTVRVTVERE